MFLLLQRFSNRISQPILVLCNRLSPGLKGRSIQMSSSTSTATTDDVSSRHAEKYLKLRFDNQTLRCLPIDPILENYVRSVAGACFSRVTPTPLSNPQVVIVSNAALDLIDMEYDPRDEDFVQYFSGNKMLPGSEGASHAYCGHQFGVFAGQLGDGAAIYLGEVINSRDERWELQLKGAGLTPYSRTADGRKVLRSSLREFLASEAMHSLGVPTTRAATCLTSDDRVIRDMFYDGHPRHEKCTVISRIAPTFIRFGSFEIFKTIDESSGRRGPSVGRDDIKASLLDFVVKNYYPEINRGSRLEDYKEFYREITKRTARLVAIWQLIGFCHGVLNTDNMHITGLTLDYGPFGFMDRFDPNHVCNSSDDGGRYSYQNQPPVCKWNLMKLAEALDPLLPYDDSSQILEAEYDKEYRSFYFHKFRSKIGLIQPLDQNKETSGGEVLSDDHLSQLLFDTMAKTGADFTNTFRSFNLSQLPSGHSSQEFKQTMESLKEKMCSHSCSLQELKVSNDAIVKSKDFQIFLMLLQSSPTLLEQIGLSRGSIDRMMSHLEQREKLKGMTPESKKEADQMLWDLFIQKYRLRLEYDVSCQPKDTDWGQVNQKRLSDMNGNNPRVVLRNHLAQGVIDAAENGDYQPVNQLLQVLMKPYEEFDGCPALASFYESPPDGTPKLRVSCSS